MDRFGEIAARVAAQIKVGGSMKKAAGPDRVLDVVRGLESLRSGFKATSDEDVLLGIFRDMAVHYRRGNVGQVRALAAELVEEMKIRLKESNVGN